MREDVQKKTVERMKKAIEANIFEVSDIEGFKHEFLEAHQV
jgi:enoyl-[acyl-carrier protein] reductase/trans-2-enoyl-CoA reductase (NAD+)